MKRWLKALVVPATVKALKYKTRIVESLGTLAPASSTAVLLASGVLRMSPGRFVPALVVGAVAWATIYTTVGMAVVWALLVGAAGLRG